MEHALLSALIIKPIGQYNASKGGILCCIVMVLVSRYGV